ncbi:hypothetical protein BKA93DRAFT_593548 [Sparassis latifolia]
MRGMNYLLITYNKTVGKSLGSSNCARRTEGEVAPTADPGQDKVGVQHWCERTGAGRTKRLGRPGEAAASHQEPYLVSYPDGYLIALRYEGSAASSRQRPCLRHLPPYRFEPEMLPSRDIVQDSDAREEPGSRKARQLRARRDLASKVTLRLAPAKRGLNEGGSVPN